MNLNEAQALFRQHSGMIAAAGVSLPGSVKSYLPKGWKQNINLAFDAQPSLQTEPSSAIPWVLTNMIDPDIIRILMAPLEMAEILGEQKKGDWTTQTDMFPVVEMTGETSSYGDYSNNGRAGVNMNWPTFQSYLFQTTVSYGELETERAGLAKINYVSELGMAAAYALNNFQNLSYAFGIANLQNYGILNNPYLTAALTPSIKAAGGTAWFVNGATNATANEVYNDIASLIQQAISQSNGLINAKSKMTLAMSPQSSQALTFANSFGVFVEDLLKKGFPNLTIKTAIQYGIQSATNTQGFTTAGNAMQLIADSVQNQKTVYAAFNEKLRSHKIVADLSAWKQKQTSGTWGTILRAPFAVVTMLGI